MILQAPTSFLTAVVALAANPPAGAALALVQVFEPPTNPPVAEPPAYPGSSATIAALINTGGRSIAVPAAYAPAVLNIPSRWLPSLLAGFGGIGDGFLPMDANCCTDMQGAWASTFLALGWTAGTPAAGPPPVLDN